MRRPLLAMLALFAFSVDAVAETANEAVDAELRKVSSLQEVIRVDVGVTRAGTRIPALMSPSDLDPNAKPTRILIVAGLNGSPKTVRAAVKIFEAYLSEERFAEQRKRLAVSLLPVVNPDDWHARRSDANAEFRDLATGWPPTGPFYSDAKRPEAAYVWRWMGLHAPDLVVEFVDDAAGVRVGKSAMELLVERGFLTSGAAVAEADSPVGAVSAKQVANVGSIPGLRVSVANGDGDFIETLLSGLKSLPPSPARLELRKRVSRTPVETATLLAKHYGHELRSVAYIPSLALIGRLRLSELTGDAAHARDVRTIVAPYVGHEKSALGKKPGGVTFAGHLVFAELARVDRDPRLVSLVKAAADFGFDENGKPRDVMPGHKQMSDAVFMGGPILAGAGRLTGERKYFDMCARHVRFLLDLNLRKDGLHRHSPLDESAWGRGNGFPALGLALILSDFPADHPDRPYLLTQFRSHMAALKRQRDPTGMWHQVVDRLESYRELSSSCMITFAMLRGLRHGWLDRDEFEPVVAKSWPAIQRRIADDGTLVDVCTGTGKQKSLRAYYERTAILGKDPRGGAMALLVATEMAAFDGTSHDGRSRARGR